MTTFTSGAGVRASTGAAAARRTIVKKASARRCAAVRGILSGVASSP
jgi:hypothetical protein